MLILARRCRAWTTAAEASGAGAAKLFLTGMIEHHRGAVAMAQQEVADGQNPEATTLARAIAASQQAEIEEMTTLLARL